MDEASPCPAVKAGKPPSRRMETSCTAPTARTSIAMTAGRDKVCTVWPEDEFTFATKDVKYRFYYTTPLLLSPHDPKVLYSGANRVFETTDGGNSWDAISPDLTGNHQEKMQKIPGGPITSMWSSLYWISVIQACESPLQKGELWVGTDDSTLQLSKDDGKTLGEDIAARNGGVDHDYEHRCVAARPRNSLHRSQPVSCERPRPLSLQDHGLRQTWQKITNGIRENDFTWVVREDPV